MNYFDKGMSQYRALEAVTAAADYFPRVNEVMQRIPNAARQLEAVELLREATMRMGASVAAFVSFVRDDDSHETYRFLLACDPVWCSEYEKRAWYANDPWLVYASTHTEPALASQIKPRSRSQTEMLELAAKYGFESAVIVPAPSSGTTSRIGALCVGSPMVRYFDGPGFAAFRIVARTLAMELHEWWIRQARAELIASSRVTPEDLELLEFERRGRSTKEIAKELHVTESSVDSRFQRLNAKLVVPNRRAAARMAVEFGLI